MGIGIGRRVSAAKSGKSTMKQHERAALAVNAYLSQFSRSRSRDLGATASTLYGGARDIYATMGYPVVLLFEDYYGRYERQDIATRIVEAKPDDTWRKLPKVLDGQTKEDASADTEFVKAWEKLVAMSDLEGDLLDDESTLWHHFYDVDVKAGIGEHAVMVLGFANGQLDQPLARNQGGRLAYVNVLHQGQAKFNESDLVTDPTNKRFGLPNVYHCAFADNQGERSVHWTRVIHVAEGDRLCGTPRLQNVYNRLIDVEKLASSSGEAGWRSITRKIVVSTKDGYKLAEGTVSADMIEDMIHGLRDVVELEGMDVNVISGDVQDPSGPLSQQIDLISAGTKIPQRKLMGSERGELASTQDDDNWNDLIAARRVLHAEPVILRRFIKRMIYAGVLPMPTSKSIYVDWPSLYELDDQEQATVTNIYAESLTKLASPGVERVIDIPMFLKTFVRGLPADAVPDEVKMLEDEDVEDEPADDASN